MTAAQATQALPPTQSQQSHSIGPVRSNLSLQAPAGMDYILLMTTFILVGFSLVMVYSTTGIVAQEKMGDAMYYLKRQLAGAVAGAVLLVIATRVPATLLRKLSPWFYVFALVSLIMTLIPGLGDTAGGATRWVKLGPIRFQPAEFVKLGVIIFMAGFFARHERKLQFFVPGLLKPMALVSVIAALLLVQPDFGSSAVIMLVVLAMAAATGARVRYLVVCGILVAICMGSLVALSPYRMQRVVSFLSPFADASGKGYQLIQSLIAVGTGQLTGVGLGASQQKLFFLPAAHTDFIFAVISEELGFVGGVAVLVGFLVLLWRGMIIAGRVADDTFSFSLAVGLTLVIVVPALLNMGVVLGLLPTKGLVLPLVGYGSSSLTASLFAVGLLLGLQRQTGEQVVRRL